MTPHSSSLAYAICRSLGSAHSGSPATLSQEGTGSQMRVCQTQLLPSPPRAAAPAESDLTPLDGGRPVSSYSVEPARGSGAGSGSGTPAGSGSLRQDVGNVGSGDAPAAYASALAKARQAPWKPDVGFGLEHAPHQARPLGDWEAELQATVAGSAHPPTAALHGSGTAPQAVRQRSGGPRAAAAARQAAETLHARSTAALGCNPAQP